MGRGDRSESHACACLHLEEDQTRRGRLLDSKLANGGLANGSTTAVPCVGDPLVKICGQQQELLAPFSHLIRCRCRSIAPKDMLYSARMSARGIHTPTGLQADRTVGILPRVGSTAGSEHLVVRASARMNAQRLKAWSPWAMNLFPTHVAIMTHKCHLSTAIRDSTAFKQWTYAY